MYTLFKHKSENIKIYVGKVLTFTFFAKDNG